MWVFHGAINPKHVYGNTPSLTAPTPVTTNKAFYLRILHRFERGWGALNLGSDGVLAVPAVQSPHVVLRRIVLGTEVTVLQLSGQRPCCQLGIGRRIQRENSPQDKEYCA